MSRADWTRAASPDITAMAAWLYFLARLERGACVEYVVRGTRGDVVTVVPAVPGHVLPARRSEPLAGRGLARYAFLQLAEGYFVLEAPQVPYRAHIRDPRLLLALTPGGPASPSGSLQSNAHADAHIMEGLAALDRAGLLEGAHPTSGCRRDAEAGPGGASNWEFHDLLFHSRSRLGLSDRPVGRKDPGVGSSIEDPIGGPSRPSEPLTASPEAGTRERPTLEGVLAERTSIRRWRKPAMDRAQLVEFLTAACGDRPAPDGSGRVSRPYPSGGGIYSLEVRPIVLRCRGIERGAYRYDPRRRELTPSASEPRFMERLLASYGLDGDAGPDVVIVTTARIGEVTHAYAGIAYSLILKEVGALMQTMYLVATAQGLAPCALGTGDCLLLAHVTGTDPLIEPAVGEFMLGG